MRGHPIGTSICPSRLSVLYLSGDRGLDLTKTEGYTVHVSHVLAGLRSKGHAVFLLTVNDSRRLPGFEEYLCVPHSYARAIHHAFPYTGTLDSLNIARTVVRLHRSRRFDVIHERFGLYSYGAILASRRLGLPLVLEVNGPNIEEKALFTHPLAGAQRVVAAALRRLCCRKADRIIAVSRLLKEIIVRDWAVPPGKVVVMPNAADVKALRWKTPPQQAKSRLGLGDAFVVGYLGSLHVWYSIDTLLEAFPTVLARMPAARLLIVGDGQARGALEARVNELGIQQSVMFTGAVPHASVPAYLAALDVAIAPYRDLPTGFFGSPIKLFEYMAAGRAIVASSVGQIPEVVRHEHSALLVAPEDPAQMSEAIIRLATDERLRGRLGEAAKDESSKYSWDQYADRLVGLYLELTHRSHTG
jgi:glycosyltransferase involved in cell wall biosynthesis